MKEILSAHLDWVLWFIVGMTALIGWIVYGIVELITNCFPRVQVVECDREHMDEEAEEK